MSNQKPPRASASALLNETQIAIAESIAVQGGKIHALEPAQWCGRRTLVFDEKGKGITVAIRSELPEMSPLRNVSLTSQEALLLLGALNYSLQAHDADTKLVGGNQGLEAILISRRLCESEIDSSTLSHHLNQIQDIIQSIEPVLSLSGQVLIDSVIEHVRPVISAQTNEALKAEPMIVPTFDEEARNRMMQQMKP